MRLYKYLIDKFYSSKYSATLCNFFFLLQADQFVHIAVAAGYK